MAMAASANAQNVLSIDDITIAPGETATVTVNLTTEQVEVGLVEFNMTFPEGFDFPAASSSEETKKGKGSNYKVVSELVDDHFDGDFTLGVTNKQKKKIVYVLLSANSSEDNFAETEGPLFTFDITATDEAQSGYIQITDFNLGDQGGNDLGGTVAENTGKITVGGAAEPKFEATIAASGRTVAFSPDKALDFTGVEGLTAYVVAKFTAAQSWLVPVEKVPAMTAVVLEGAAGKVEIPYTDEDVTAPETNLLTPVTEAFTVTDAQYGTIWVMSGGKFKKAAVGLNIPVGKAYVELDAATAKFIGDELDIAYGEPTGIETINAQLDDNAPIYNLNGVRVNKLQKGVYIQNGHKFIVK